MKIDTVTHFTDEIAVVELSTLREEMTFILPETHEIEGVIQTDGMTYIHIQKKAG